jgi:hypothetical protein
VVLIGVLGVVWLVKLFGCVLFAGIFVLFVTVVVVLEGVVVLFVFGIVLFV